MKYIGEDFIRVDGKEKLRGKAIYVDDIEMDNLCYAAVVRSKIPYGKILEINRDEVPFEDIIGLYTYEDFPREPIYGYPVCDNHILAKDEVNYIGDAICVVCADSITKARKAADKVKVYYKEEEPIFNVKSSKKLLNKMIVKKCEDKTFGDELTEVTLELSTKHQEHAYIEVEGAVATYKDNKMSIYAPMQSPMTAKNNMMRIMNLNNIQVIQTTVGGGFGGKDDVVYEAIGFAALCAYKTGRPCKYIPTREESIISSYKRHPIKTIYNIKADGEGKFKKIMVRSVMDGGAYASVSNFVQYRNTTHSAGPYVYDSCDIENRVLYTNNVYSGAFRGFGGLQACFFYDTVIDELSYKLNMDPIELRLKNVWREGLLTSTNEKIKKEPSPFYILNRIRKVSNWDLRREEFKRFNEKNRFIKKGIGVSLAYHGISLGAEGEDYAESEVYYDRDKNKIIVTSGITELGQGSRTVFCEIAAEVLEVLPSYIEVNNYDTEIIKDSGPTVASRGSTVGGMAVKGACLKFKDMVLKHKKGDLMEVLKRSNENVKASYRYDMPRIDWNEEKGLGIPYVAYHFGAHVCTLTVNMATGEISIDKYYAIHDIGKNINPLGLKGQIAGGIAMGIGYALMEDIDIYKGVINNKNFNSYLIPTSMDMPEIYTEAVEYTEPLGPFGAKGTGEPVISPVPSCIGNAIRFAVSKRLCDLPFSLEKIKIGKELSRHEDN